MAPLSMRDLLGKGDVVVIQPYAVPDPITYPTLIFNLVFRTTMGFLAIFACLVPLRILYRNKEFAAIVFVVNDLGLCLINTINALIWHNDNMDEWFMGWGWCDLHPYLYVPMMTLFTTSVLAHSRSMAEKLSLVRANPMTKAERRRTYILQSLIMFPLPIIQMAWMYPLTAQRFVVSTLVGCDWRVDGSWPWLTFFILPIPILSIWAGIYAFITWRRYRVLRKSTRGVFASDSAAAARSNRTARRLYLLTLTILIPYVPLTCAFAALNISQNYPIRAFNFHKIHYEAEPFPWNSILIVPSTELPFVFLNAKYIPIFSGLLILFFFGGTQDAINDYRRVLVAFGLGRIFPILHNEYHRDKPDTDLRTITVDSDDEGKNALKSTAKTSTFRLKNLGHSSKASDGSDATKNRTTGSSPDDYPDLISPVEHVDWQPAVPSSAAKRRNGSPSTPKDRPTTPLREYFSTPTAPGDQPILAPERTANPFLFRTHINLPPISLPSFSFLRRKQGRAGGSSDPDASSTRHIAVATPASPSDHVHRIDSATSNSSFTLHDHSRSKISTCVWSEDGDISQQGQMSNLHPLQVYPEEPEASTAQDGGVKVETQITQNAR